MNALTIAWREVRSFFLSPMAYVVLTGWMLWCGGAFYILCSAYAQQQLMSSSGTDTPLTSFYGGTTLFYFPLFLFVPVMTMRLLAEEFRSGTIEALITAPVSEGSIVIGKYLASLVFWIALWVPTLLYVFFLHNYGDVDWKATAAIFVGLFGLGLHYVAIGVLMSAIARNQIVAALLTFTVLSLLFVFGIAADFVGVEGTARDMLDYISVWSHMASFSRGIIDSRHLVYDVSVGALCVFLAIRVLESRRWAR